MKNLLLIVLLSPVFTTMNGDLAQITSAIKNGDASALSQYFDENVEISVLDRESVYDKAQAKEVVAVFFSKHKPQSYSEVHKGVSKKEDSHYSIGKLISSSGAYRVYVYTTIQNGKYRIQELRFDKE